MFCLGSGTYNEMMHYVYDYAVLLKDINFLVV